MSWYQKHLEFVDGLIALLMIHNHSKVYIEIWQYQHDSYSVCQTDTCFFSSCINYDIEDTTMVIVEFVGYIHCLSPELILQSKQPNVFSHLCL